MLAGLAWFNKKVLQEVWAHFVGWIRGLPVKIYARLGLVTRAEHLQMETRFQVKLHEQVERTAALEKEIQGLKDAQKKSGAAPAPLPPVAAPLPVLGWKGPKTVERFWVKFDLVDPIGQYLGKFNPPDVPDNVIKSFLQGPFCRNCNHSLSDKQLVGLAMADVVLDKCPACGYAWRKSTGELVFLFIRRVYNILDAEFRSTGKVAETDSKDDPLFLSIFDSMPKKPW
ncbi:MAG: hypothetical protein ACRD5H_06960 [Nitrososphaerales archaeon]